MTKTIMTAWTSQKNPALTCPPRHVLKWPNPVAVPELNLTVILYMHLDYIFEMKELQFTLKHSFNKEL